MGFDVNQPRDRSGRWTDGAADLLRSDGGFTLNVNGKPYTKGIAVAVPPPGGRRDWLELDRHATGDDIQKFVDDNFEALRGENIAVGGWRDTENEIDVIDVSEIHTDPRSAANAAVIGRQNSAFDLETFEEIKTQDLLAKGIESQYDGQAARYGDFEVLRKDKVLRGLKDGETTPHYIVHRVGPDGKRVGAVKEFKFSFGHNILTGHDAPEGQQMGHDRAAQWIMKKNRPKGLSLSFDTPYVSGVEYDFAKHDGKLAFWKQILPQKSIHYTGKDGKRHTIDFTKEYLTDLATNQAVDKIGFLLADKDNAHTMDPERWRGDVVAMEVRDDGLYGKIVFPSVDAAKAVIDNPELGVSARIREGVSKSDGSTVSRGIIHVLGTLDPQVSGMSSWQTADLSTETDVLDLSNENYEDTMTDKTEPKALADYTEAEIDAMTEEELDTFLAAHVPDYATYTENIVEDEQVLAEAGADMSNEAKPAEIDLAAQAVAHANARADEALRRVAEAEWREERSAYIADGVPPHALDLAMPVLNRADDMVIDLSNTDEEDVNVSGVIRGLLDAMKGTVDLANEDGHTGTFAAGRDGEDPDKDMLDRWLAQS